MSHSNISAARDASRLVWVAEGHLRSGRIAEGIEGLDKAAAALCAARDDRAYVDVAKRILTLAPNRVDILRGLASAQLRWGDVEGAGQSIVAWLRLRPGATEAVEAMAEVFGRRGRREQAAQTLARLALRELHEGRPGAAARLCERARSWDDSQPDVLAVAQRMTELSIEPSEAWALSPELGVAPSTRPRTKTIAARTVQRRPETGAYIAAGGNDPEYALAAVGL